MAEAGARAWTLQSLRGAVATATSNPLAVMLPAQDFPVQNSLCLLKRAAWYLDRACAHVTPGADRLSGAGAAAEGGPRAEASYDDGDDGGTHDYADYDDDEIEDFYFSSAAGRARVVLGNRRFGEGGYIANGRRQARVTPPQRRVRTSVAGFWGGGRGPAICCAWWEGRSKGHRQGLFRST